MDEVGRDGWDWGVERGEGSRRMFRHGGPLVFIMDIDMMYSIYLEIRKSEEMYVGK